LLLIDANELQGDSLAGNDVERTGSSPHTDWGWITLIMQQEDVTGLELWHDEEWHPIPPVRGSLLVNIGDYVSLLTGGRFKSPLHRVTTSNKERTSFTFFFYPSYDAEIPMTVPPHEASILYTNQATGQAISEDEVRIAQPKLHYAYSCYNTPW